MDKYDYKELGLMCGLEIHQQLDSKTKLFCRCPNELQGTKPPDFTINRFRLQGNRRDYSIEIHAISNIDVKMEGLKHLVLVKLLLPLISYGLYILNKLIFLMNTM